MSAALALDPLTDDDDGYVDWAVAWRLMNYREAHNATGAERLLAVWLLLDSGHAPPRIRERTGLDADEVERCVLLRRLAGKPDWVRGAGGGRTPRDARMLAPTEWQRTMLGVPAGITRPGSKGASS